MNEFERYTLVARLVARLREAGSWASRTHIQKCLYFVQRMSGQPAVFNFVMYHYGPYSFQLEADVQQMRSLGVFDLTVLPPYGPRYQVTEAACALFDRFGEALREFETPIDFVVGEIGSRHVTELELLATADFVQHTAGKPDDEVVAQVLELKPHFSEKEVKQALTEIEEISARAPAAQARDLAG